MKNNFEVFNRLRNSIKILIDFARRSQFPYTREIYDRDIYTLYGVVLGTFASLSRLLASQNVDPLPRFEIA